MASSTEKIAITNSKYTNISMGNDNLALMIRFNQKIRVIAGDYGADPDAGPDINDEAYFHVSGGKEEFPGSRYVMSFNNLSANVEDDVWVRAESGDDSVIVVRGEILMSHRGS
jgi:hypothetical protein